MSKFSESASDFLAMYPATFHPTHSAHQLSDTVKLASYALPQSNHVVAGFPTVRTHLNAMMHWDSEGAVVAGFPTVGMQLIQFDCHGSFRLRRRIAREPRLSGGILSNRNHRMSRKATPCLRMLQPCLRMLQPRLRLASVMLAESRGGKHHANGATIHHAYVLLSGH
jgi:hypothetical protein